MSPQFCFFASVVFGVIAWGVVTAQYIWPKLRSLDRAEALRPILTLHSFRFIGLAFLVPGVVSADLPSAFARSAAYGDFIAAILAVLSLMLLSRGGGIAMAWIFNIWGMIDLFSAFYLANRTGLAAGQLGVMFFVPTLIVPLLLITHVVVFRILLQPHRQSAMQESRLSA